MAVSKYEDNEALMLHDNGVSVLVEGSIHKRDSFYLGGEGLRFVKVVLVVGSMHKRCSSYLGFEGLRFVRVVLPLATVCLSNGVVVDNM